MKLKYPHLPKTLGTIIQEKYLTFYPSEPFRMSHFEMRYPVSTFSLIKANSSNDMNQFLWFYDYIVDIV